MTKAYAAAIALVLTVTTAVAQTDPIARANALSHEIERSLFKEASTRQPLKSAAYLRLKTEYCAIPDPIDRFLVFSNMWNRRRDKTDTPWRTWEAFIAYWKGQFPCPGALQSRKLEFKN